MNSATKNSNNSGRLKEPVKKLHQGRGVFHIAVSIEQSHDRRPPASPSRDRPSQATWTQTELIDSDANVLTMGVDEFQQPAACTLQCRPQGNTEGIIAAKALLDNQHITVALWNYKIS